MIQACFLLILAIDLTVDFWPLRYVTSLPVPDLTDDWWYLVILLLLLRNWLVMSWQFMMMTLTWPDDDDWRLHCHSIDFDDTWLTDSGIRWRKLFGDDHWYDCSLRDHYSILHYGILMIRYWWWWWCLWWYHIDDCWRWCPDTWKYLLFDYSILMIQLVFWPCNRRVPDVWWWWWYWYRLDDTTDCIPHFLEILIVMIYLQWWPRRTMMIILLLKVLFIDDIVDAVMKWWVFFWHLR